MDQCSNALEVGLQGNSRLLLDQSAGQQCASIGAVRTELPILSVLRVNMALLDGAPESLE